MGARLLETGTAWRLAKGALLQASLDFLGYTKPKDRSVTEFQDPFHIISSYLIIYVIHFHHVECFRYQDYYGILGVPRDASPQQIRQAFKKMAIETHPDKLSLRLKREPTTWETQDANSAYQQVTKVGMNWKRTKKNNIKYWALMISLHRLYWTEASAKITFCRKFVCTMATSHISRNYNTAGFATFAFTFFHFGRKRDCCRPSRFWMMTSAARCMMQNNWAEKWWVCEWSKWGTCNS